MCVILHECVHYTQSISQMKLHDKEDWAVQLLQTGNMYGQHGGETWTWPLITSFDSQEELTGFLYYEDM